MKEEVELVVSTNYLKEIFNFEKILYILYPEYVSDGKLIIPTRFYLDDKDKFIKDTNNLIYAYKSDKFSKVYMMKLLTTPYNLPKKYSDMKDEVIRILKMTKEEFSFLAKEEKVETWRELIDKRYNIINLVNFFRKINIIIYWLSKRFNSDENIIKNIIKWNCKGDNVSSDKKSIINAILIYYLNILQVSNKVKQDIAKKTGMVEVPGDGNCMFSCFSKLRRNDGILSVSLKSREEIADMIHYLYINFREFRDTLDGGILEINEFEDIDEYLIYIKKNGNWGGEPELIAACQLYNVNIEILSFDEIKREFKLYNKIKPIYSNSILKEEMYKQENLDTWTLFYVGEKDKKNHYNYKKDIKKGNSIRIKYIDYTMMNLLFLTQNNQQSIEDLQNNCVINPFVKCENGKICNFSSEVCEDDDGKDHDENIYEYTNENGDKYIGYESDFWKIKNNYKNWNKKPYNRLT